MLDMSFALVRCTAKRNIFSHYPSSRNEQIQSLNPNMVAGDPEIFHSQIVHSHPVSMWMSMLRDSAFFHHSSMTIYSIWCVLQTSPCIPISSFHLWCPSCPQFVDHHQQSLVHS